MALLSLTWPYMQCMYMYILYSISLELTLSVKSQYRRHENLTLTVKILELPHK